jgi:hypothetical protein
MGIPTCIYIPHQAVEDDDASMLSCCQSSPSTPTVEVRPLRQGGHQKWKGSKGDCDQAIKMPHRCDSQVIISIPEDDEDEEHTKRDPHQAGLGFFQIVDCKRRLRLSLKEETLASCMGHNTLDESHDSDRPPRMPRRNIQGGRVVTVNERWPVREHVHTS